ncbi:hypothetical protein DSUL_150090 [Desulfovibrionales bacterium]
MRRYCQQTIITKKTTVQAGYCRILSVLLHCRIPLQDCKQRLLTTEIATPNLKLNCTSENTPPHKKNEKRTFFHCTATLDQLSIIVSRVIRKNC